MVARPIWFGSKDRPLFGWFHHPVDGSARSAVVMCPPFAREYLQSHYAMRLLAEQLTSRGICALRFDYDGTGDSAGASSDGDRVGAWVDSIHHAMHVVRRTRVSRISLLGMRIGALLAAEAAAEDGQIDRIVLWDPCPSGKSYLRESRVLAAQLLGDEVGADGSGVEAPGFVCDRQTVEDLGSLSLSDLPGVPARRALVLIRPDRTMPSEVLEGLGRDSVDCRKATGQSDLMDKGSPHQVLPHALITEIAEWIAADESGVRSPLRMPPPAGSAVVGCDHLNRPIIERPFPIPPHGLFGMLTDGPAPTVPGAPTALFLSVANEHHVGPNRLWVDLSRRWAAEGIRSLRLDLSGLGDSPVRHPGQAPFVARALEAFDDVVDAARAASPEDPSNVVLVGLCAAGYQAIESAFDLMPRGILAINPVLSFVPPECQAGSPVDSRRRVALPRNALVEAFHDDGLLSPLRRRVPDLGWWLRLSTVGTRRPGSWLARLARDGVNVLIVAGEREWRPIRLGSTRLTRERWMRSGRLRFAFIPDLEHGLLISRQRTQVFDLVTDHVIEHFSSIGAPSETMEYSA